jgi:cell division protein FtsB
MEKEVNKMFRGQRNLLLLIALCLFTTMFLLTGFGPMVKSEQTINSDLSWEKMYYEMKKQRDSMEVERDDLEKKFEESVKYWQQCESKLNK